MKILESITAWVVFILFIGLVLSVHYIKPLTKPWKWLYKKIDRLDYELDMVE